MHEKRRQFPIAPLPVRGGGGKSAASRPALLAGIDVRTSRRRAPGGGARTEPSIADGTGPSALLAYWKECRHGMRLPSRASLDLRRIAFCWPGSVLFRIGVDGRDVDGRLLQVERVIHGAASFSGKAGSDDGASALPGSSAVTEWLLSVVRGVARSGKWTERAETFAGTDGASTVRALALPVGSEAARVEFVLCNVCSSPRPVH